MNRKSPGNKYELDELIQKENQTGCASASKGQEWTYYLLTLF